MNFSVLLSVYNGEQPVHFDKSLESLSNQTLKADQIVIVKDGYINEMLQAVIDKYRKELNIKEVALKTNQGLGKALNKGLQHCDYDIVARIDTDDIAMPERFEKQIRYLSNNPKVAAIGTGIIEFNEDPGDLESKRILPERGLKEFAKKRNPLNHPTVLFRKKFVQKVGSYKPMKLFEDYYLWIRLLNNDCEIKNIEEPLLYFRVGNDMIGRRHGLKYLNYELTFYTTVYKTGYINFFEFLQIIILRVPFRIIPKKILAKIYDKILRT